MDESKKCIIEAIHSLFYIMSLLEHDDPRMVKVDKAVCKLMDIYPNYAEETNEPV
jgi:hypothetical protein